MECLVCIFLSGGFLSSSLPLPYLSEEGLVDLHALVGALGQNLAAAVPAVADGRVGVGHAAQEHRPLVVELLFGLADALVHRHDRVVQVWRGSRRGQFNGGRGRGNHVQILCHCTAVDLSGSSTLWEYFSLFVCAPLRLEKVGL